MLRNDLGDPGAVANNTQPQVFATNLPGGLGYMAIYNDTPYALDITIPNGTFRMASGVARLIATGDQVTNQGTWQVVASILPTSTLYSDLYLEAYGLDEVILEYYPLNIIRQQASKSTVSVPTSAANAFEQDFLTPFVLTGLVASKDVSIANQLDVTAGIAFLRQADQSLGRVAPLASIAGQFTTSALSTTYFLDLNPDATFSFATTHSAVSNHLTIASCTTDGSGNILVVTDARNLFATIFPNADRAGAFVLRVINSDAGLIFSDGSANLTAKGITVTGAVKSLGGQATAGSFGVPPIVAQTPAAGVNVIVNTLTTILSYNVPTTGRFRISLHVVKQNASISAVEAAITYVDPYSTFGSTAAFFTWAGNPPVQMNGANNVAANQAIATSPLVCVAKGGTAVAVVFRDPTGTVNDFVDVVIEQLS